MNNAVIGPGDGSVSWTLNAEPPPVSSIPKATRYVRPAVSVAVAGVALPGYVRVMICSPFAAYLTGHWLVLDGANWLRRNVVMPDFTPVRDTLPKRPK